MILESKVYEISLKEECENGKDFVVDYFLLEDVYDACQSYACCKYGLKLEKRYLDTDTAECSYYPNLVQTKREASHLIDILYHHTVTPVAADDVLMDL